MRFEQVVFAGGGNRCWWQAGWWDVVAPRLGLAPEVIAGVSAGAATACLLYANDSETALRYYESALAHNTRNVHWDRLFVAGERVFPHARIYRTALRTLLGGDHFTRLQSRAPELRVQCARLPRGLGPRLATALGLVAYNVEKYARQSLHPTFGRRLGFTPAITRVQDCATDEQLVSLLIASSCTPPFTPIERIAGQPLLDGGLVDNVPVDAVDRDRPTLVLVTRRYRRHPPWWRDGQRCYVQPSERCPAASWDYTRPHTMRATYALGRRDGEAFLRATARGDLFGS